ncbi:hypothetical protein L911_2311 [Vibrio fluvialis I21563]|nr:hypothetical protein L911_2311 [Vibrio fluvialis I21563]
MILIRTRLPHQHHEVMRFHATRMAQVNFRLSQHHLLSFTSSTSH